MLPLQEGTVYGPVRSRRLGQSLGLNILPRNTKLCTFNCTYCQYGWTRNQPRDGMSVAAAWPAPPVVARAVELRLRRAAGQRERVDRLTFSGHGEPTLHPAFGEVVDAVCEVRDRLAPSLPIAILSNSSTLDQPRVAAALGRLDERYMKLDAGDATLLRRVNASPVSLPRIIEGLQALDKLVVQTMFVRDRLARIDNSSDLALAAWIQALEQIKPEAVHIYTIDREPAWPYLQAVVPARLEEIARRVRSAGFTAHTFYGAVASSKAS